MPHDQELKPQRYIRQPVPVYFGEPLGGGYSIYHGVVIDWPSGEGYEERLLAFIDDEPGIIEHAYKVRWIDGHITIWHDGTLTFPDGQVIVPGDCWGVTSCVLSAAEWLPELKRLLAEIW
jgi:hypothetical protein